MVGKFKIQYNTPLFQPDKWHDILREPLADATIFPPILFDCIEDAAKYIKANHYYINMIESFRIVPFDIDEYINQKMELFEAQKKLIQN
jgi:hypothetical protein